MLSVAMLMNVLNIGQQDIETALNLFNYLTDQSVTRL